ncbi:23S rRNA m(2)A-2503 methyltransferase [Acetitomaculum ruminis DSM 5522]|uniref:Probable dual-specificity RNA methyltransferase RlmN n=1 Tax=Acetitomaculum ruminis DSM 5522 TaxID=1120918 RepID=A0A1I0XWL9_9FIRM|nr:23S rRNA (adenine(2503)-C(2))-methyltransferase RlmN [Acetitomaculum ruminis]SFB04353.1 23S rRNA m(2)A-2503 methyltransferase [Acetitomaculum ruminis DSM 5522]
MIEKTDLKSMTREELECECEKLGLKKFRAKQIFEWMHKKKATDFDEMTNLSKELRNQLKEGYFLDNLTILDVLESKIDGTKKFLFKLSDGNVIESVFMKYSFGNSVCISSQAGCKMGCRFCASGIGGLAKSLSAAQMLSQIYQIENFTNERVSHVVVMGSGEPFDNYENLIKFIMIISDSSGLNISKRNLTVSTCGIIPKIKEFSDLKLPVTLAISLHAPNQEKRKELMPVANKYHYDELIESCKYFVKETGRRITFEYSLCAGVNDSIQDADELSKNLKGINAHVNLIPVNPVKERSFKNPLQKSVKDFKKQLENNGINVTIRREMGRDINGACGQLRRSYIESEELG